MASLLILLLFLPLLGAIVVAALGPKRGDAIRWTDSPDHLRGGAMERQPERAPRQVA